MDTTHGPVPPHGGRLIRRSVPAEQRAAAVAEASQLRRLVIDARTAADLELIANGAYSPLEGFMTREDYACVLEDMHLANGLPWTLPITLTVREDEAQGLRYEQRVCLVDEHGTPLASLLILDRFHYDKVREAACVYGTTDPAHPGVRELYRRGEVALGGPITLLRQPANPFRRYCLDPADVRASIERRGWRTVVAFQTRNPLHRAHEYLQKCALEIVDGLLLHPLVGPTKDDDLPADVRLQTYEVMLKRYYPSERVLLAVFPAAMRYAGPREAVFHALVRKNYGCSHFIVGRNHAGVGDYYGPYDAQRLFERFDPAALGVTPLFFEHAFYCRSCGCMATTKTCPHTDAERVILSGSEVRRRLAAGEPLDAAFTRPEVARILLAYAQRVRGVREPVLKAGDGFR